MGARLKLRQKQPEKLAALVSVSKKNAGKVLFYNVLYLVKKMSKSPGRNQALSWRQLRKRSLQDIQSKRNFLNKIKPSSNWRLWKLTSTILVFMNWWPKTLRERPSPKP